MRTLTKLVALLLLALLLGVCFAPYSSYVHCSPHYGGQNDKLNIYYCYTTRQHSSPHPDVDVGDCDGPLVHLVNAQEPAEPIWPLVF